MKGLSYEIESAIRNMITGLRYNISLDLLDDDKVRVAMDSKISAFNASKQLLNRWVQSDNAPNKEKQQIYAEELVLAGKEALEGLREALTKDIDFDSLDATKFASAIKSKPIILTAIFDLELSILELSNQLSEDSLNFGTQEFKVGYPERVARGEFFPQDKHYKDWHDEEKDAVCICPLGTKGELIEIDELKIWLPKPPRNKKHILFSDLPKKDQHWRRPEPPESIRPDNVEKHAAYIIEEFRRRKEGVWFMNNGKATYIPGFFYFALTAFKMKDNGGFMDFRMAQLRMAYHMQACMVDPRCWGEAFLKSRRTGFTFMVLALILNFSTMTSNAKVGLTSKTGTDAEEAFEKLSYAFLNLPFYFRPVVRGKEDSLTELVFGMPSDNSKEAKKARKMDITFYLNTTVDYRTTKDGSYDSVALNLYLGDEAGKWERPQDYIKHVGTIRPTMVPNGTVVGKAFIGSTMGSMDKGGRQFKELLEDSYVSKRHPVTQMTPSNLYFSFLPAQANMSRFTDKYGVCHEVKPTTPTYNLKGQLITLGSIEYLLAVEESLKGNDIALNEQYRTYPRTVKHAMRDDAALATFNTEKINSQMEYNDDKGIKPISGNFEWKDKKDGDVEWHPSPKGRFKIWWMPSEADDTMYMRNRVKKMGDKYYPLNDEIGAFGCDPFSIKSTVGQGSKGAIHGKTRVNATGAPSNKFFLEYIARPADENIFFEDVIMACRFYGMPVLVESNRIDLLRHMRNRGYRGFSMNRLDKPTKQLNPNEIEYGGQTMSGRDILDSHMNAIGGWIEKNVGLSTNEEVRPLGEMGEMPFEETLTDWSKFDPDARTKFDASISSGLAIMACQKEHYKPNVKKPDTIKVTSFLKKYSNKGTVGKLINKKEPNYEYD